MATEEESKTIDFEEDILLPFGKRVLAVLGHYALAVILNAVKGSVSLLSS